MESGPYTTRAGSGQPALATIPATFDARSPLSGG